MILSVALNDFEPHYIIINEKTKNNIMDQSDFHRLIYSDEFVSINGIYLIFSLLTKALALIFAPFGILKNTDRFLDAVPIKIWSTFNPNRDNGVRRVYNFAGAYW